MKIKKLKIKLNKDNEYSDYRYFIPKSNNIKMTDGRDVDEAVQSLKDKIANLKEQANYLISKAPLVKYAEGTSITITDCAEAPLKKFSIKGNSYQETRSGRNLFNKNGETTTIYINANGEEEEKTDVYVKQIINNPSENYVMSFKKNNNNAYVRFSYYNGNTFIKRELGNTQGYVFTVPTDCTKIDVRTNINKLNSTVYFEELQIEKGTTATEYEDYGVSPSMEYEAPIKSVGDNINLCDNQFRQGSYNIPTNTIRLFTTQNYKVEAGKTYTLATNLDFKTYKYSIGLAVSEFPEVAQSDLYYDSGWLEKAETTFTSEQDGYFGIGITRQNAGVVVPEDIKDFYFKLVEGTSTGVYSPYGQGSIEIKNVNKNILKLYDIAETTRNGLTYSCINGKIKINGTATVLTNIWFNDLDIKMNVGEYTLSSNTNLQGKGSVALKDLNGNIVQTNLNTPAKITLNENRTATQFLLQISSGSTFTNFEMEIQLEKGETATEYIPHQSQTKALYTQQPFRAIGDVKDRFIKKDGVWYEEHNINRKVYKGTETFRVTPNGNKLQIFVNDLNDIGKVGSFCNMLKSVNDIWNISEYQDVIKISDNLTAVNIMLQNTEINTINLLKEKLTTLYNIGTPLYVDYILKTPMLIPCTMEQIEILDNLQSYDKITYYNVDKINNVQANIKLIYKQDINAILEEKGV